MKTEVANFENFSLDELLDSSAKNPYDRAKFISEYYAKSQEIGLSPYFREISSPVSNHITLKDRDSSPIVLMGSNSYFSLNNHPEVIRATQDAIGIWGTGMGGPPHLCGMSSIHRQLERRLSIAKNKEDSLLTASGYQANLSWVSAMVKKGDLVLFDELHHASLVDGLAMTQARNDFRSLRFRHNDASHLERLLQRFSKTSNAVFVTVEGVYSMDGDIAPLPAIVEVCKKYNAFIVVDDAHGTGVIGKGCSGTAGHFGLENEVDLVVGTFSKVMGVTGGFISGKKEIIDFLRFFSRPYMFSAHLPIANVASAIKCMDLLEADPSFQSRLHKNAQSLRSRLKEIGYKVLGETGIIPVCISPDINIRVMNKFLQENGLFTNPVEFPAVPIDEQRFRLSVMSEHTQNDLSLVIDLFEKAMGNSH